MRLFVLSLVLLALVAGCNRTDETPAVPKPAPTPVATTDTTATAPSDSITFADAYVPVAPAGGMTALFVRITGGATPDTLIGAGSHLAQRVELHESYTRDDGMRSMRPVESGIPIPAHTTVALEPGGFHAMLIGLPRPLVAGDTVTMTLQFAQAGDRYARVAIRSLSDLPTPQP